MHLNDKNQLTSTEHISMYVIEKNCKCNLLPKRLFNCYLFKYMCHSKMSEKSLKLKIKMYC